MIGFSEISNTKLINLRYKYLGYYLGVRSRRGDFRAGMLLMTRIARTGVRMNKFETIFYVVIIFFCQINIYRKTF